MSSKDSASEVSGRGLGMGAVRAAVRDAGGELSLETEPGRGTVIHMRFGPEMLAEAPLRPWHHERKVAS